MNCSKAAALLPLLATLLPAPAAAVLGEGLASVQADTLRLAATRRIASGLETQVHTLAQADGSTIRQYVGADGRVYAISWNTRYKPRLDALLGAHFPAYAEAARAAQQLRAGVRHAASLSHGDLVVESLAHLNAHAGRAWLRSRLPAAGSADAIR
ncbi:conserved exported hypothetical protein [Rubrivivax sp. A210]|uniref:DUF2844 domain-containing protein n=1 Tax=Rubrivivax sp. A210 TaxID=2772301 RepID=UPI00191B2F06|nr:DUF2844 domain-containing protein [Rubrivivax sp. A210]CAD5366372.1 conserved exported hypothetical protein [Rubrivivax sp. A210]